MANKTPFGKKFTRTDFFEAVIAMCKGNEMAADLVETLIEASEYEIDKIENAAARAAERKEASEGKNVLDSDYAKAIIKDVISLAQKGTSFTGAELVKLAAEKKLVSHTGKPYTVMWVGRVLGELAAQGKGLVATTKMVDTTDGVGSPIKREIKAYKHA